MSLQQSDRAARVGQAARERHARWLVVAVGEAERCDARSFERFAGRDDVRLIGMSAEAMQHQGAADGARLWEMQSPL